MHIHMHIHIHMNMHIHHAYAYAYTQDEFISSVTSEKQAEEQEIRTEQAKRKLRHRFSKVLRIMALHSKYTRTDFWETFRSFCLDDLTKEFISFEDDDDLQVSLISILVLFYFYMRSFLKLHLMITLIIILGLFYFSMRSLLTLDLRIRRPAGQYWRYLVAATCSVPSWVILSTRLSDT